MVTGQDVFELLILSCLVLAVLTLPPPVPWLGGWYRWLTHADCLLLTCHTLFSSPSLQGHGWAGEVPHHHHLILQGSHG